MSKKFWQSRLTLVALGVVAGLSARWILGPPAPEAPPKPFFTRPLGAETDIALPILPSENLSADKKAPSKP